MVVEREIHMSPEGELLCADHVRGGVNRPGWITLTAAEKTAWSVKYGETCKCEICAIETSNRTSRANRR